ncbi:MAG TPA: hypothetical protein VIN06_13610 [Devosia sp.]
MTILWRVMFLAEKYGRMTLTLDEVAEQIGLAPATIKSRRVRGEFQWLRTDARMLYADVRDVADWIEQQRKPPDAGTVAPAAVAIGNHRYVVVSRAAELTGYTAKAIQRKIQDGVWPEGVVWKRAPDGRVLIDMDGYGRWVENGNPQEPGVRRTKARP